MYIETTRPRRPGNLARLSITALSFSGATCITFFYHMYGATIGRLQVTANGQTVTLQVVIKTALGSRPT